MVVIIEEFWEGDVFVVVDYVIGLEVFGCFV